MNRVAIRDGLFTLDVDSPETRLLASRCPNCGRCTFPTQVLCPFCGAEDPTTIELSRRGTVEVCTTVVNRPPGYDGPMPFGFGVVALPEGIKVISRIRNPDAVRSGTPVRLVLDKLGESDGSEIVTYAFEAEE